MFIKLFNKCSILFSFFVMAMEPGGHKLLHTNCTFIVSCLNNQRTDHVMSRPRPKQSKAVTNIVDLLLETAAQYRTNDDDLFWLTLLLGGGGGGGAERSCARLTCGTVHKKALIE